MDWNQVKAAIPQETVVCLRAAAPDAEYGNVAVLSELERSPSERTVYFCRISALKPLLPLLRDGRYTLVLCADDPGLPPEALPDAVCNLAALSSPEAYAAAYAALREQLESTRLLEDRFRELVALSRRSPPLSQIARQISLLYNGAPVFILNDTFTLLASSVTDERFEPLRRDAERGNIPPALLARMQALPDKLSPADGQTTIVKHPGAFFKCYDTVILANSIVIGSLSVFIEDEKRLSDVEVAYLANIANLLSHRLQQSDYHLANEYNRSSRLFSMILSGTDVGAQQLRERMRGFGYDLREQMRLIAVKPTDASLAGPELLSYGRSIRDVFPNSIFVVQDQQILFLMSYSPADAPTQGMVDAWGSRLARHKVRVGVSSEFSDLLEAQSKREEALAALELGAAYYPNECVCLYDGLRAHRIIRDLERTDDQMSRYLYPPVTDVLSYDRAHNTQLLKTLYLFLLDPKDPLSACRALHIHKNTLYQRLRRLQSFFPAAYSIGVQAQIYLSLLLLMREGQLYFDVEPESCLPAENA